jgi:hypothetical protein
MNDKVLLIIQVNADIADGNWNYPHLIDNQIITKKEADIIKFICERYPNHETSFWTGKIFEVKLSDFEVRYIYDQTAIAVIEKIYGERYGSDFLYDYLVDGVSSCYRHLIECSVKDGMMLEDLVDSHDTYNTYFDKEDCLDLSKLVIVDNQIMVDPTQTFKALGMLQTSSRTFNKKINND